MMGIVRESEIRVNPDGLRVDDQRIVLAAVRFLILTVGITLISGFVAADCSGGRWNCPCDGTLPRQARNGGQPRRWYDGYHLYTAAARNRTQAVLDRMVSE